MDNFCIICDQGNSFTKIEHIVPESMGNLHYILKPGVVCDECNNKFSEFEKKVLTKSIWGFERVRRAVKTKKKKPSESKTNVKVRGDEKFRKNVIIISDLKDQDVTNFDEVLGQFKMTVKDFDGSENAMGKFLIKVGIESLFRSHKKFFAKHDFSEAKRFLRNIDTRDWPFVMTDQEIVKEKDVPRYTDKHRLSKIYCRLTFGIYMDSIIFRFNLSSG